MNPAKVCLFKFNNYNKAWNMFTVNNRIYNQTLFRIFIPLNFATTKIRFKIRLAENGTRIGGI